MPPNNPQFQAAPAAETASEEIVGQLPSNSTMAAALASEDKIRSILQLAEKSDQLVAAFVKIRRAVLQMALPGDWVRFGSADKAMLSLDGAGAERIATMFGISFRNFRSVKEDGSDRLGPFYTWVYSCDVELGGRIIEAVEGRAGSRDKFFGYANDQWKELSDVNESNIRQAARRNAMKEGVRQMLGLRAISEEDAPGLGLDMRVVRGYQFGSKGEAGHATKGGRPASTVAPAGKASPGEQRSIVKVAEIKPLKRGTYTITCVVAEEGDTFETFKGEIVTKSGVKVGDWAEIAWEPNKKDPTKYAPVLLAMRKSSEPKPPPPADMPPAENTGPADPAKPASNNSEAEHPTGQKNESGEYVWDTK